MSDNELLQKTLRKATSRETELGSVKNDLGSFKIKVNSKFDKIIENIEVLTLKEDITLGA